LWIPARTHKFHKQIGFCRELVKKYATREFTTELREERSRFHGEMPNKRKYVPIEKTHSDVDAENSLLFQYQEKTHDECLQALLTTLNRKNTCKHFTKKIKQYIPTTHNMVCTTHVTTDSKKIDLDVISNCVPNSTYDKKRFAAITIRLEEPRTTALLFSSGKLVVTGAVSKQMAISAVRSTIYILEKVFPYLNISSRSFSVQNIVCNIKIPHIDSIDVATLYEKISTHCTYQPSIFPGLIFRPPESPIVLLIFKSSRIVVTGAREYDDVVDGFSRVYPMLNEFFVSNVSQ
jgi:transcription initiation factor TFIID TATA-box-binding protein